METILWIVVSMAIGFLWGRTAMRYQSAKAGRYDFAGKTYTVVEGQPTNAELESRLPGLIRKTLASGALDADIERVNHRNANRNRA